MKFIILLMACMMSVSCINIKIDTNTETRRFTNLVGYERKTEMSILKGYSYTEKWDDVKPVIQDNLQIGVHQVNNCNEVKVHKAPKIRRVQRSDFHKHSRSVESQSTSERSVVSDERLETMSNSNTNSMRYKSESSVKTENAPNMVDSSKFKWYYRYHENRPENSSIPYK